MTPFGLKLRQIREAFGKTQKQMASDLRISAAYLSALEHGNRGRPAMEFVIEVCSYLELLGEDAEELKRLARLSHPKVVVDTSMLGPNATELANLLAENIAALDDQTIDWMLAEIRGHMGSPGGPTH